MQETYPLALGLNACRMLGIDPIDMLRQAGLGDLDPKQAALGVTAIQYVAAWDAMVCLAGRDDLPSQLGIAIARGPIVPVFLALDCAPDLEQGLRRITRYKSLIGPTRMHVFGDDAELTVEYDSSIPGLDLSASILALYLAFVVEKARLMTARPRFVGGDGTGSRTTTCRAIPHQQHVRQGFKRAADTTAVGQS